MAVNDQVIYASSSVVSAGGKSSNPMLRQRVAWLEFGPGRLRKLVYNAYTTPEELHDSIVYSGGKTPDTHAAMLRSRTERDLIVINADMPQSSLRAPYLVEFIRIKRLNETAERLSNPNAFENGSERGGGSTKGASGSRSRRAGRASGNGRSSGAKSGQGAGGNGVEVGTIATIPELNETSHRTDEQYHNDMVKALSQLSQNFERAFQAKNRNEDLLTRLDNLSRRLQTDNMRANDIDIVKAEVNRLRDEFNETILLPTNLDAISIGSKSSSNSDLAHVIGFEEVHSPDDDITIRAVRREPPAYIKYRFSQEVLNMLKRPAFDVWNWEAMEMLSLLEHMFEDLGLVDAYKIRSTVLRRWLSCIMANYRNNPFHNFRHCFCVTQMMYGIVYLCNLQTHLSKFDLAVLLTACICHDLDHPGYNNAYQVNARTELAIRYNDNSPLENHHAAVTFEILKQPKCNIFEQMDEDMFAEFRTQVIALIMSTDMAKHSEYMEQFRRVIESGFNWSDKQHLLILKKTIVKACDISNEVRPIDVSKPWLDHLLEEYFNQGDRERATGLPVGALMDRTKVTRSEAQIGFIKFVLIPTFDSLSKVLPPVHEELIPLLMQALNYYEELKTEEDQMLQLEQDEKADSFKEQQPLPQQESNADAEANGKARKSKKSSTASVLRAVRAALPEDGDEW